MSQPGQPGQDVPDEPSAAEAVAKLFHDTYERLAPEHGYQTRTASAVPWADVPAANKTLMIAVAGVVGAQIRKDERAKIAEAERAEIIAGIKDYFAASDDPLYEDVRVLCGRIERGEYGARGER